MSIVLGDNDLPLHGNSNDIRIYHYILNLHCCMKEKIFKGSIILFVKQPKENQSASVFSVRDCILFENITNSDIKYHKFKDSYRSFLSLKLDACSLKVIDVEEIQFIKPLHDKLNSTSQTYSLKHMSKIYKKCENVENILSIRTMKYKFDEWCLEIFNNNDNLTFPNVIRINYETNPYGKSLRWLIDQDGNQCVYTAGMWINNRSLFPSQEFGCISTWQAKISIEESLEGYFPLMSSDNEKILFGNKYYFESATPVPSFTLTIAVGKWRSNLLTLSKNYIPKINDCICFHEPECPITFNRKHMSFKLYSPAVLIDNVYGCLQKMLEKCIQSLENILGPHPFYRLDIVIFPSSSQDLAFASPNILFLSQSLFTKDDQFLTLKLAHEISHSWFGLLIGAKDWTEEWLSEGFATFMEDFLIDNVLNLSDKMSYELIEVRNILKLKTLKAEIANSNTELQRLRPNKGDSVDNTVVKNGINPEKQFSQIHYLKGHFLLSHLYKLCGKYRFKEFLKKYIQTFHGAMVSSKDILNIFLEINPDLNIDEDEIFECWLDSHELPKELLNFNFEPKSNELFCDVVKAKEFWIIFNQSVKCIKKKKLDVEVIKLSSCFQLMLLLDLLIEEWSNIKVKTKTMKYLNEIYRFAEQNAEIQHRWCELIINHKYRNGYKEVEMFLIHHQAMGVYLYGEITILGDNILKKIVKEVVLEKIKNQMDTGVRDTVMKMVYGN